jgi:hypothetical protein
VRRRLVIGGAASGIAILLLAILFVLFFGRIAAWAVKERVLPRVQARLDRELSVGGIDVSADLVVLRDVVVSGPEDAPGVPLAFLPQVTVEYDVWQALAGDPQIGKVTVEGAKLRVLREQGGADNVSDLIARLTGGQDEPRAHKAGNVAPTGLRPKKVSITGASFIATDADSGTTVRGQGITVDLVPGAPLVVQAADVAVDTDFGPQAGAKRVVVRASPQNVRGTATVEVIQGWASLWPGMSLTGIRGRFAPGPDPGRAQIQFSGGYGAVEGQLWQADGWLAPASRSGRIDLRAERFTFDRLRPLLERSMIKDFDATSVDLRATVTVAEGVGEVDGEFNLVGLTIEHEKLAEQPVRNLSFSAAIKARFDSRARSISLTDAAIEYRGVAARLDGFAFLPGGIEGSTGERRSARRVAVHLVVPPVRCQTALDAMPRELIPHLQGFRLKGQFDSDLYLDVDWADLQATVLKGRINLAGCKVLEAPEAVNAQNYMFSFEHFHPGRAGEYDSYLLGPENPDFIPLWDISPHLINSIMSTEDSRFYQHNGFIPSEFRSALVRNLQAGRFKYGASSITMQTVKNVLLYRDKLLSRKLQELFLTWYLETELEKDRILEIYLNAIEYGPGIWGIGPAARHYFGKHPRDLNPVEAAFFSSILPAPRPRYIQYCRNALSRFTKNKIPRILDIMLKRERLSEGEYYLTQTGAYTLEFRYPDGFDPKACEKLVEEYSDLPEPVDE